MEDRALGLRKSTTTIQEKKTVGFESKILEIFYTNVLFFGFLGLEIGLVVYLVQTSFFDNYELIIPIGIPAAFLVVIGAMLAVNKILNWKYTSKSFEFKQMFVFSGKPKKEDKKEGKIEKKTLKPRTLSAPKIEYGTHNCPVHGVEKCIGSFSNVHSCNSPESTSETFWQE